MKLFKGKITFSTRLKNIRGVKFWAKFASQFEKNEFVDDEVWRNFVVQND